MATSRAEYIGFSSLHALPHFATSQRTKSGRANLWTRQGFIWPVKRVSFGRYLALQLADMAATLYRRLAEDALVAALADTPVVLIHGPRQCGKTTLALLVGKRRGYRYYTFDDAATLAAARGDLEHRNRGKVQDRTSGKHHKADAQHFRSIQVVLKRRYCDIWVVRWRPILFSVPTCLRKTNA